MAKADNKPSEGGDTAATPAAEEKGVRVKYLGDTLHNRVLNDADFKRAGLDGVGKQSWNKDNNHTVTLDNKDAVKFLTESKVFEVNGKPSFKVLGAGEL